MGSYVKCSSVMNSDTDIIFMVHFLVCQFEVTLTTRFNDEEKYSMSRPTDGRVLDTILFRDINRISN